MTLGSQQHGIRGVCTPANLITFGSDKRGRRTGQALWPSPRPCRSLALARNLFGKERRTGCSYPTMWLVPVSIRVLSRSGSVGPPGPETKQEVGSPCASKLLRGFFRCWPCRGGSLPRAWHAAHSCQAPAGRDDAGAQFPEPGKSSLARWCKQKKKSALEKDQGSRSWLVTTWLKARSTGPHACGRSTEGISSVPRAPQHCSASRERASDLAGRREGQQLALLKNYCPTGSAFRGSTHACHAAKQTEPRSDPTL